MKYTIDSPSLKIEVLGLPQPEQRIVALLVHLPGANARTAAMFGRHAAKVWETQPEYAAFAFENGAHVVPWDGKVLDFPNSTAIKEASIGTLRSQRVTGEISAVGKWWTIAAPAADTKEAILAAEGAG
jgi:hypothetical protein